MVSSFLRDTVITCEDGIYYACRKWVISKDQRDEYVSELNKEKNAIQNDDTRTEEYKTDAVATIDVLLGKVCE